MGCDLVERVSWTSISQDVASINGEFAEAVDLLLKDIKSTPSIFRARYPYGGLIVDKGQFRPPCGTDQCSVCEDLLRETNFSSIPLSFVLTNAAEVHLVREGADFDSIPLRIMSRGEPFGVFEVLDRLLGTADARPPWSVSSGSRSVVIVAPIGDRRLPRAFSTPVEWTKNDTHWRLVQEVNQWEQAWCTEVVFFPSAFLHKLSERKKHNDKLFTLLLRVGWQQSSTLRHGSSREAELRRVYLDGPAKSVAGQMPELQQFATVQHLFEIADGSFPGFVPCHDSNCSLGPFMKFSEHLKNALSAIAGKTKTSDNGTYRPLILHPRHLQKPGDFAYYSFRRPTVASAANESAIRNFSELPYEIKRCVDMLAKQLPHRGCIDLERTRYFAQSGRFDIAAAVKSFPELGGAEGRVFLDSQFFVAGVRIVKV